MARIRTLLLSIVVFLSFPAPESSRTLTPVQVDEIVNELLKSLSNYIFPDIAEKLQRTIQAHQSEYRGIGSREALAARLTDDLRKVGHDRHLLIEVDEELGLQKDPTPAQKEHAHAFDDANGYGIRSIRRLPGNIGYVNLAYISPDRNASTAIAAMMQLVSGTDALIVDLRHNVGGSLETAIALLSYFFEEPTELSSILERTRGRIGRRQNWTVPYVAGPRYLGKPVFVLTGRHTQSAAELCAYDLQATKRATIVGEQTAGEANSSTGEIALGYGFAANIPDGRTRNPITGGNWERTGVRPDIATNTGAALIVAYEISLKEPKGRFDSELISSERKAAIVDPQRALLEEIAGFP